tara:strand:- start:96 stop:542 length:447 start_codon:yes stop_codon:yes gene_type:complete
MRKALGWIVGILVMGSLSYAFVELTNGWAFADSGHYDSEGNEIKNGSFLMFAILTVSIWAGMLTAGGKVSTHWVASLTGYFFVVAMFGYMIEHIRVSNSMGWVLLLAEVGLIFGGGWLVIAHCMKIDREALEEADRKRRLTESYNSVL